jgi:ParB-like chromosome segregation protein Spo0J
MFEKSERLQVFECEPSKVIVPEGRIRKEFDPKKLRDLADSLKNPGMNQLQAGICYLSEGRPILVAGERRLRACTLASVPFCFTLQNETDELTIREIEIEENLNRVNFNWFEEVSAKEELHKIRQMRGGIAVPGSKTGVSIRDTAQELGVSYGNLAEDVELAQFAQQIPEVRAAKSKTEAKKIVKRLKEQVTRHVVLERAKKSAETKGEFRIIQKGEKSPEEHLAEQAAFFTQKILRGTMEEQLSALPDETFHLVIFDPPWGVSYDKVSANAGDKEMYEDSPETFDENIELWLRLIYQKMAPNSHLYMFFGIVNYQRV